MPFINKIEITGFKAFPDKFTLTLEGKHLLMYGENGSGKSSIFYSLHCIFQSPLKSDGGKKYFNVKNDDGSPNNQHLKNLDNLDIESRILIDFTERHPFIYIVDKNGFNTTLIDGRHPLPANITGCFINHKFLFHFFNFRNSQRINLFPVFVKDILPFIKDDRSGYHIGEMYDILTSSIIKRGNKVAKEYLKNIDYFNEQVKEVIEDINLSASDIYNKYFKDNDDKELQIRLRYDSNADKPEGDPMEYWLKYDRIIEYIKVNDTVQEKPSRYKRLNSPFIGMEVSEKLLDGTFRLITNPHVHFNEAKLTAIALSIRFSLLNLDKAADGRFLALDDMLISLDMSNRAKVVDFLLHISDKYKVYLFTHDRVFFENLKERIFYFNKSKNLPPYDGWVVKELYNDGNTFSNPTQLDSESDVARALKHYKDFDYPACANYLRKALESLLNEILPSKLLRQDNGDRHEKLRNTLDAAFSFFQKIPEFDLRDMSRLIGSLNLLLNPLSHKSTETNIYKTELKEIFAILERIKLQILSLKITEVYPRTSIMYMYFTEDEHITQKFEIELRAELYIYELDGIKHIYQPESRSKRSCTITDGVEEDYRPNAHYKGTLEKICQDVHTRKEKVYANNYIDFYKDKDGTPLSSLI